MVDLQDEASVSQFEAPKGGKALNLIQVDPKNGGKFFLSLSFWFFT